MSYGAVLLTPVLLHFTCMAQDVLQGAVQLGASMILDCFACQAARTVARNRAALAAGSCSMSYDSVTTKHA